ncbi:MAG: hypothetical protein M3314_04850, partial [Actinomycetota bacterium]|nr:hypothetical protein [Actinomycetota bacterium]
RIRMGLVRPGSPEERVMRRIERAAARRSRAIITLTDAAIPVLEERHGAYISGKVRVIPTCVDLKRFAASSMPPREPLRLLFSGSFNPLYDLELSVRFIHCLRRRRTVKVSVLTPADTSRPSALAGLDADFGTVPFSEMPARIAAEHAGLGILRRDAGVGLRAAAPTKLAEFLACGRPIVVNAGLGDMERLVRDYGCGIVVHESSEKGLRHAADELLEVIDDPETPQRCRRVAERHFDIERGVDMLVEVYRLASR